MEANEQISQEWSCLISGVYTAEEADFINQLLGNGNCSLPEQLYQHFNLDTQTAIWHGHESSENNITYFPANSNSMGFLQGSSSTADSSKYFFPTTNGGNNSLTNSVHDGKQMNENTDQELEDLDTGKDVAADIEHEILVSEPEKDKTRSQEKSEKRSRSSFEVLKNKRNVKSKKNPTPASISNTKEKASPDPQSQNLSSYCSDDDSNTCKELHGGASSSLSLKDSTPLKLNGKSRSSRNPATDPQSAYARRRRERINERLRILQNLVPNGTKVDISTMLEEAVQYVKFLQLQIKLLSSDDLWMYAPIAYNGMTIGLELNINTTKQPKKCIT